jgi:hypothetical protein
MRCCVEVAALRAEARDDAEQVTQLVRGEWLEVEERRDGWVRARTSYGYPGWTREEFVCEDDPLALARSFLGSPYEWGGLTAAGIDCSGLVHMSFRACGRLVPRDADQQEEAGERLLEADLRAGDLITYGPPAAADHIAFWVGGGRILHSTQRDGIDGVVEENEPAELRERRRALLRLGVGER